MLSFGNKASGVEGYTAHLYTTNNDGLYIATSTASGGFSEGTARLNITDGGTVTWLMPTGTEFRVNEEGNDADFRVESDSNTHALFVNAGNSRVGINDSDPQGHLSINGLDITFLSRAYTMSTTPVEVLLLDNQGNTPVFIRVYRVDTGSPQGSELIELYIACYGSGTNITSVVLVQDDKVQNGSIHDVTFTAAVVSNNVRISVTGSDAGGEPQTLYFECHHVAGAISVL
jgi:hypothetical protein